MKRAIFSGIAVAGALIGFPALAANPAQSEEAQRLLLAQQQPGGGQQQPGSQQQYGGGKQPGGGVRALW